MKGLNPHTIPVFNAIRNLEKVSFYSNGIASARGIGSDLNFDRIRPVNLVSLGAMKLEVMSRRSAFRDYYDVYSLG